MAYDGSLNFNTKVDTYGFNKGTRSISSSLGSLKSTVLKVGAAIGVAFGVAKLIQFGKQAIETASDLQEVQNVVDTAFGSMSYKMEEFANNSIKQFGISKLAAKQTGSTFMAMASGMGLAQDSASDMAIALTGLSADMASFYNTEQEVASTALKSIFTGETETLKQYGIVMTEANLEAYALSQGINKKISAMTQAEKVQLRYNYVMAQTKLAQGDFAKTQDSWANQTRILSEQWKEFSGIIGNIFMNVLAPAVKGLNTLLSGLISVATEAGNALAKLFGFELQSSSTAAKTAESTSQIAENAESTEESTKKTSENNKDNLASFDKINKINKISNDNSGTSQINTPSVSMTDINVSSTKQYSKFASEFKNTLSTLFEPIKSAWEAKGKPVVDSIKNMFFSIKGLLGEIGQSFATVWTNGTGQQTVELLLSIWTNINNTIANIAQQLSTAWTTDNLGTEIVQHAADIWNTLLKYVDRITKKISEWAGKLDFTPLLKALNDIEIALQPFAENVGQGLEWFFDNVLLPIRSWVVEEVVPNFLESIAGALKLINKVWKTAKPFLQYLWEEFLQPIGKWIGSVVSDFLSGLAQVLTDIANNQTAVDVLTAVALEIGAIVTAWGLWNVALGIWNALMAVNPLTWIIAAFAAVVAAIVLCITYWDEIKEVIGAVWDWICNLFQSVGEWIWNNMLKPIVDFFSNAWKSIKSVWSAVKGFFAGIWQGIKNVFTNVKEWFVNIFTNAWNGIKSVWSAVKEFFGGIWQGVKDVFGAVGDWFGNIFSTAWDNIKSAWGSVKTWFKNLFNGIWDIIKGVINSIIGGFESVVNAIIGGINGLIGGVDTVVSAVGDLFGQDWNVPKIPEVKIPRLATGTVVPAHYGNFLATLGDNKREPEVVSPLSTMKQAFKEAIAESGYGGNQSVVIETNGDLDGLVSLLNFQIKKQERLAGATI